MTDDTPAARVRARLDVLGVGMRPTDDVLGQPVVDRSPEAIGAQDLGESGLVQIADRQGNSWSGSDSDALEAIADLDPGVEHREVWERLVHA